jgi:hypothetical protein
MNSLRFPAFFTDQQQCLRADFMNNIIQHI